MSSYTPIVMHIIKSIAKEGEFKIKGKVLSITNVYIPRVIYIVRRKLRRNPSLIWYFTFCISSLLQKRIDLRYKELLINYQRMHSKGYIVRRQFRNSSKNYYFRCLTSNLHTYIRGILVLFIIFYIFDMPQAISLQNGRLYLKFEILCIFACFRFKLKDCFCVNERNRTLQLNYSNDHL